LSLIEYATGKWSEIEEGRKSDLSLNGEKLVEEIRGTPTFGLPEVCLYLCIHFQKLKK